MKELQEKLTEKRWNRTVVIAGRNATICKALPASIKKNVFIYIFFLCSICVTPTNRYALKQFTIEDSVLHTVGIWLNRSKKMEIKG